MSKIIRISEFQHKLPLNIINDDFNGFYEQFLKSDLGAYSDETVHPIPGQTEQLFL